MFLYYDVIDDKKVISVISKIKLDYLGDNYIEKDEVPKSGILYLDDEGNIKVEAIKELNPYEAMKKEVEESNKMTSEANIELLEQVNKIQEQVTNAMVEMYELLGQVQS